MLEADGRLTTPVGTLPDGTPIYRRPVSNGFLLAVEGRPAALNRPVGKSTFDWDPSNPNVLPDLQIVVSRPLGNGSSTVCDALDPVIGGVPAVDPPSFGGSQQVANAINDLSCRFSALEPGEPCTRDAEGGFRTVDSSSTVQFCTAPGVGAELAFPSGDTRVTVRLRDSLGVVGTPVSIIVRIGN